WACRCRTSRRRWARRDRCRGGGWRSPSGRTGCWSSTTRTTPTRSRCGPRWPRWSACPAAGGRGPGPGRWPSWAAAPRPGTGAPAEHEAVGHLAATVGVERVVVVGSEAGRIGAGTRREPSWRGESVHVPDVRAAVELLRREVRAGDVVLVKASRAAGLERVAQ